MSKKLPSQFEVKIEKFSFAGEGVGRYGGREVFVYGALPGETVMARPLKKRRKGITAGFLEVIKPAAARRPAAEDHFFSCSPWQIIPEELQFKYKRESAERMFRESAGKLPQSDPGIVGGERLWHYRNKMEFSFTENKSGGLSLALHKRGSRYECWPLTGCAIAHERINACAGEIVKTLAAQNIKREQLKYLLIRYGYFEDKCLAALFVADENFPVGGADIPGLAGWRIIYSDPRTPATVTTKVLHEEGRDYLTEEISGLKLKYYYDSFFQTNPPAFSGLLSYLKDNIRPGGTLIDLYSGVGTIGFSLARDFERVISVEFDLRAAEAARFNLSVNKIANAAVIGGAAEKQDLSVILSKADTVIVDPPRTGLHPKVIKAILEKAPENFIYISCNPLTQARDFALFKKKYRARHWRLFDLYPQTPHMESVIIMEKRKWWKIF
ncbi:MAG: methyltransferase [Candidatus Falkowbacteria bacterium]